MSIKDGILAEIKRETLNTGRVLDNLSNEHWNYKPHEKSMTLGELASHVVELHNWVHHSLSKDVFDFYADYTPPKAASVEELKAELEKGLQKNNEFVNAQTDEFWLTNWTLKAGEQTLSKMPKLGAFRFIITNHLIHHRGQLTVYMRLLNIPVPGNYGPSADEK
ncbi:MAG: DinB family protein [Weeksellaceae bacterium]